MTAANLNVQLIERRMLKASEAATYCGLPARKFPAICSVEPVEIDAGIVRYDRRLLDEWLDALSSGALDSDDAVLEKLR